MSTNKIGVVSQELRFKQNRACDHRAVMLRRGSAEQDSSRGAAPATMPARRLSARLKNKTATNNASSQVPKATARRKRAASASPSPPLALPPPPPLARPSTSRRSSRASSSATMDHTASTTGPRSAKEGTKRARVEHEATPTTPALPIPAVKPAPGAAAAAACVCTCCHCCPPSDPPTPCNSSTIAF